MSQARCLLITGRVQGVGFRPHVYRLAHALDLLGEVRNEGGLVRIHVQGALAQLDCFEQQVIEQAPPLSRPILDSVTVTAHLGIDCFKIVSSQASHAKAYLPPDQFCCDACLAEMLDPAERRYFYPFTNCTQCGPRYTIIKKLPYDRPHTAMAKFPLCPVCHKEYSNPLDRRFHAQPLACPHCGPQLTWQQKAHKTHGDSALQLAVNALKEGLVIAVKGIGGYHLLCDARNEQAVQTLRKRKKRPHKPLAVMFPQRGYNGLAEVSAATQATQQHDAALLDPIRPIVLISLKSKHGLAPSVAPGLDELGVMLPYSPLHHLLLHQLGTPVVATSGNISGEPVLTEVDDAAERLAPLVDGFLHHNRPILRPADDGLVRIIADKPRMLRPGRGMAPVELKLPVALEQPALAVGGQMKNAIALGWGDRAVLSPHIGEMESPRSAEVFLQVCQDLPAIHDVEVAQVVHDAHPGYTPTRLAKGWGKSTTPVGHHHAHASSLAGEHGVGGRDHLLMFTWDGTGLGEGSPATLWGGEAFLGGPGHWQRQGSMRPFKLPGGDRVGREPWRAAASLCWALGHAYPQAPQEAELLHKAWQKDINAPLSTAVGRLFDAAAALVGLVQKASFEGQGPFMLEALCGGEEGEVIALPHSFDDHGIWRCDWAPLVAALLDNNRPVKARAQLFHSSMAAALVTQAMAIQKRHRIEAVGLSGGVFQNRHLTEQVVTRLQQQGMPILLHTQLPMNDGGLAYGQLVELAAIQAQD
ncbi:carbamoyltransferase HypF [Magnetococcus sp. PR-3]|uniref:carbamoyltransferase HypF n=1 Tax=Magnetococcus sp. PR-3 TaxID=3120355 RepID=UPI002FCE3190